MTKRPFRRITRAEARLSFTSQHPTLANEPVKVRAKRTNPEADIQAAIVRFIRMQYPSIMISASLAGTALKGGMVAMQRAKKAGLLVGLPDLCLICDYSTVIFLEVKSAKGVLSDAQKNVHYELKRMGHKVEVVRSVEDVQHILKHQLPFSYLKEPVRGLPVEELPF